MHQQASAGSRPLSTVVCAPIDTRLLTVADIETLIAAALCAERQAVIPVIGEAVNELLDAEREHHKSELASTTRGLAIAKLEGRRERAGAGTGHRARQGSRSAEPVEARE